MATFLISVLAAAGLVAGAGNATAPVRSAAAVPAKLAVASVKSQAGCFAPAKGTKVLKAECAKLAAAGGAAAGGGHTSTYVAGAAAAAVVGTTVAVASDSSK